MARNKLSDLNDHLFAQIERLTEEGIDDEMFELEKERSRCLSNLSKQVIGVHKLVLDAAKLANDGGIVNDDLKTRYGLKEKNN